MMTMATSRLGMVLFGIMILLPQCGAAKAWEVYDHSTPYDTEIVSSNPHRVEVTFTDPVAFKDASMIDAAGHDIPVRFGIPEDDTLDMLIWLPDDLGPGSYTLSWHVYVTSHGHPDSGEIRFTIKAP